MPSAWDRKVAQAIMDTGQAIRKRGGNMPSPEVMDRAARKMGTQGDIVHVCGAARLIWVQGSERRYPVTLLLALPELDADVIDAVCPCEAGAAGQTCYHVIAALASVRVQNGAKLKT